MYIVTAKKLRDDSQTCGMLLVSALIYCNDTQINSSKN